MIRPELRCDVCRVPVVEFAGRWVHVDPLRAALSQAAEHDPVKVDDATASYLRDVLGGGGR